MISVSRQLPRPQLDGLRKQAERDGFNFVENDDEAAWIEFETAGMDLHDFQQDFVVNEGVNVTFFTADPPFQRVLASADSLRIASLDELFATKALVSAKRSRSRDWFDLWWLMTRNGYTARDYRAVFQNAGTPEACDRGLQRLCSGVLSAGDEGYEQLLIAESAPSVSQLAEFFRGVRDEIEIYEAEKRRR